MMEKREQIKPPKIHTPFKETAVEDPTIKICLNCTAARCRGWCDRIRRYKKTNE